jgi:hypothetical protein
LPNASLPSHHLIINAYHIYGISHSLIYPLLSYSVLIYKTFRMPLFVDGEME